MASSNARKGRRARRGVGVCVAVAALGSSLLIAAPASADPASADLSVSLSHSPSSGKTQEPMTFTLTAANAGPDVAEDVVAGIGFDWPLEVQELPEECTRSNGNNSVVCTVGDLAAEASASIEITAVPYSAGVYTIPAAVSSETPDPDLDDRSTTATIIVQRGPSFAERYVRGLYPVLLDRDVDAGSLGFWAERWKRAYFTGTPPRVTVPSGIMNSDEYRRLRIRASYQRILGRAADPSGLASWVGKARNGMSYLRIEQALISSNEFRTKNAGNLVEAVYDAVLGDFGDGVPRMSVVLDTPQAVGTFVGFLQRTLEGRDAVIDRIYDTAFGEDPDAFGRFIMLGRLRDGATPERLLAELLVSWKFTEQFPLTDDDYNEWYGEPIETQRHDFTDGAEALSSALAAAD